MNTEYIADRFLNQVALVVGGAQGIGKAIAVRLACEGAQVVIADRDAVMMKGTAAEIAEKGGAIHTVVCDVRLARQVDRMVEQVVRRYKKIDILMYVAGVVQALPFVRTGEKDPGQHSECQSEGSLSYVSRSRPAYDQAKARQVSFHVFFRPTPGTQRRSLPLTTRRRLACTCFVRRSPAS